MKVNMRDWDYDNGNLIVDHQNALAAILGESETLPFWLSEEEAIVGHIDALYRMHGIPTASEMNEFEQWTDSVDVALQTLSGGKTFTRMGSTLATLRRWYDKGVSAEDAAKEWYRLAING